MAPDAFVQAVKAEAASRNKPWLPEYDAMVWKVMNGDVSAWPDAEPGRLPEFVAMVRDLAREKNVPYIIVDRNGRRLLFHEGVARVIV